MPKDISSSKLRFNIHKRIQVFFDDVILKRGLDYFHTRAEFKRFIEKMDIFILPLKEHIRIT